jgi:phosphoenolpyruvate-protein phosphotransferase (PTS system enzyme I)
MPAPLRLKGLPASAGFASGLLWQPPKSVGGYRPKESRGQELAALEGAIESAIAETADLVAGAEGEAAEILEFQLAMIEDDNFRTVSSEKIEQGLAADAAWTATLDAEIEGYQTSGDEYFRARATDLADIRDRVLAALTGTEAPRIPVGSIYFSDDIAPSTFLSHDWMGGGLVLKHGSATGHVAILARQRGIPVIVGIGDAGINAGIFALVDAVRGEIVLDPGESERASFEAARHGHAQRRAASQAFAPRPAITADGRVVKVMVNIADPGETASIDIAHVDGVGLMRTEFLFGHGLPAEEEQYKAYRRVLDWARGKPVTIRTIDAGGDKPVAGLTEDEPNPFLGMRGVRLSLAKPEIFAIQIRALLRAAVAGNLKVMLPMVSVPQEVDAARGMFAEEAARLEADGIAHAMPQIGIMVEVPSVAVTPGRFAMAEFFSIGSNDLVQYVLAASRDNWKLEVSLCGDAASNPEMVPHLLSAGLESLSVAASAIGEVKAAIARWRPGVAE